MHTIRSFDRLALLVLLGALLSLCAYVLMPFAAALLWAGVLVLSTRPIHAMLERRLPGRRVLAASLMTVGTLLVLVVPTALLAFSLADETADLAGLVRSTLASGLPELPGWVGTLPVVGEQIRSSWAAAEGDAAKLAQSMAGFVDPAAKAVLATLGTIARGLIDLLIAILIAFFLWLHAEEIADYARKGAIRLSPRVAGLMDVATATAHGVVVGIIGTALAQGFVAAVGFLIAGVPGAILLGVLVAAVSIIPFGTIMVWLPVAVWLFIDAGPGWGLFMAAWGAGLISTVDNFIRPFLISMGTDLPLILTILGGLGGIMAFGLTGLLIGPVALALAHSLFMVWVAGSKPAGAPPAQDVGQP
jgi:predicted PurR-regulated permease PerM